MKIVCGRSDCAYEYNSHCTLKQIAVGKDFKCHSYKCSYDASAVESFEKSIERVGIKIMGVEEMQPDDELDYFTAEQVRKMTPEQVRNNYTKIIQSMKRWN